jgi:elongation factor Ts
MAISAQDVMELRRRTGLGMMECKQALHESNGDMDKAVDWLRQKGLARMDSRTERASGETRVMASVSQDKTRAVLVEISAETDFTANSDAFKSMIKTVAAEAIKQPAGKVQPTPPIQAAIDNVRLTTKENVQFVRGNVLSGAQGTRIGSYVHFTGKVGVLVETFAEGPAPDDQLLSDLCMHVAAAAPPPIAVSETGIPADVLEKERQIAKSQAIEQGKPQPIAEKMVEGKIRKFYEENVLLKQVFIKDEKKRVQDILPKGVTIKSFVRF